MLIYCSIFFILMLSSFYELFAVKRYSVMRIFKCILIVCLIFLATIRGGPYSDYYAYKDVFENYTILDKFLVGRNFVFEPLYSLIEWICKWLYNNFIFFEFVLALIVMLSQHYYADSYSEYTKAGQETKRRAGDYYFTIMFFLWGLYKCNVLFIRSSIALVICLNAIKHIQTRNLKKFLVVVLIAAGFHYSALIFIPSYYIYKWHMQLWKKMCFFVIGTILMSLSIQHLIKAIVIIIGGDYGDKIASYLNMNGMEYGVYATGSSSVVIFLLRIFLNIGLLIFAGIYLVKIDNGNKELEGYFNLYLVGSALYASSLLNVGYAFARISIYYNILQIPMLMSFFSKSRIHNKNKVIYWIVLACYLFTRFFVNTVNQPFIGFWE